MMRITCRRKPPKPPRQWRLLWHPRLQLLRKLTRATRWGLLPGLGALQRGDRELAALQGGAVLGLAVLYLLLWTSPLQAFVPWALLALMGHAMVVEQGERVPGYLQTARRPGVLLAMAACLLVWSVQSAAFAVAIPSVSMGPTQPLEQGSFLVHELPLEEVEVGQLVVRERFLFGLGDAMVTPVVALPGQTISCDGRGTVYVDGVPSPVPALGTGRTRALSERVVPPGHISVLDLSVLPIRYSNVDGVLYYRWLPHSLRGPLPLLTALPPDGERP